MRRMTEQIKDMEISLSVGLLRALVLSCITDEMKLVKSVQPVLTFFIKFRADTKAEMQTKRNRSDWEADERNNWKTWICSLIHSEYRKVYLWAWKPQMTIWKCFFLSESGAQNPEKGQFDFPNSNNDGMLVGLTRKTGVAECVKLWRLCVFLWGDDRPLNLLQSTVLWHVQLFSAAACVASGSVFWWQVEKGGVAAVI